MVGHSRESETALPGSLGANLNGGAFSSCSSVATALVSSADRFLSSSRFGIVDRPLFCSWIFVWLYLSEI